jgi:hypothetical protein
MTLNDRLFCLRVRKFLEVDMKIKKQSCKEEEERWGMDKDKKEIALH